MWLFQLVAKIHFYEKLWNSWSSVLKENQQENILKEVEAKNLPKFRWFKPLQLVTDTYTVKGRMEFSAKYRNGPLCGLGQFKNASLE